MVTTKMQNESRHERRIAQRLSGARGVTVIEMVVVIGVGLIVATLAVLGIRAATSFRDRARLDDTARSFAGNIERARADAMKRHATASVTVLDATRYRIVMDFGGDGTVENRDYLLENGVTFYNLPTVMPTTSMNWRGRASTPFMVVLRNPNGDTRTLRVSTAGATTIDDNRSVNLNTAVNVNQSTSAGVACDDSYGNNNLAIPIP